MNHTNTTAVFFGMILLLGLNYHFSGTREYKLRCGSGTILVDHECISKSPYALECGRGTMKNGSFCIADHIETYPSIPLPNATSNIKKTSNEKYYDDKYHKWQVPANKFGGLVKGDFLNAFVKALQMPDVFPRNVLEFGSSAGFIINAVYATSRKYGVEIGDFAREYHTAKFPHIASLKVSEDAPKGVDFIYSWSVLEHVDCPICELKKLAKLLSVSGFLFIHVKNEGMVETQFSWKPGDINNHVYTWNGLLLGNMVQASDLRICQTSSQFEAWKTVDASYYREKKCVWCKSCLEHGRHVHSHSVYAVAVRTDSSEDQCLKAKTALNFVLGCRSLC